ncbi:hypothetical protein [Methylobacterium sp. WSM2598]|uniref:hypothetical protein n=1 Tax=Methylobacterium sp. WSM2598 TaxID=398261 RepID=UPI0012F6A406|nr:hypothetical protein [Methylobacterium sp. WSM2598]
MTSSDQIDIRNSAPKIAAEFLVGAAGLVLCIAFLYIRPGQNGSNSMTYGVIGEFASIFGAILFGFYCAIIVKNVIFKGVVISVGRRGIFDRRVSTGWIPWNAIRDISVVDRHTQKVLLFKLSRTDEAVKALRRKMNDVVRNNASGTPQEFYVGAGALTGGFAGLRSAVTRFHDIV